MKHLKILLTNAPVNNGNRGCVALTYSMMYLLDELLTKKEYTYDFFLPQSGFGHGEERFVTINNKIIKYVCISDFEAKGLKNGILYRLKYHKRRKYVHFLKGVDFCFDIGQGDSFSDIYGFGRFEWINNTYRNMRKYRIPTCIMPQTIGPFIDTAVKKDAVKSIKSCRLVLARDKKSADYVKGIVQNIIVPEIIDVAFFLPYKKKHFKRDGNTIHVGLNVSALLWNGGYTKDNQFNLKENYKETIKNILEYFLDMPNVIVHLIPHVVNGERDIENDYEVSYNLYEDLNNPRLMLSPFFLDPMIAKSYIAGLDFMLGARMHATIGAFSSGVPVLPMAYSRKFNGLFVDTLNYPYMADLKTDDMISIMGIVKHAFENRAKLSEIIAERMRGIVEDRKKLLKAKINDFLEFRK